MYLKDIKEKIFNSQNISAEEAFFIFDLIMKGDISEIEISAILISLKIKSETKDEIFGAAKCMREKSLKIFLSSNIVDTCGTGGDLSGTLNISTCAAIVAASAGVKITKHGNRSISSKCGSADMLEALGYRITNNIKEIELSFQKNNFCFLFAQNHHTAMKYVMNVRKNLGTRTIFNLLGPLTNPANAKIQLMGVYDKKWVNIHCETLKNLGSNRAMVVHGADGLDEISLSNVTFISELKNNIIKNYIFDPRDYGYNFINNLDIKGGDPKYNAQKFKEMLNGSNKNFQKIIEINAGATLYLSGISKDLKEGFHLAKKVIDEKKTKNYLTKLIS
jgi:anthranilate phosphoribosyltransferase